MKHLRSVGICEWKDLDREHLQRFRDHIVKAVAQSSAHTMCAELKAFLGRRDDLLDLPRHWREILDVPNLKSVRTYLTPEEIDAFAAVEPQSKHERTVQYDFLIECLTGMRVSDALALTPENFQKRKRGYLLSYVSIKTKTPATIPVSRKVLEMVVWVKEFGTKNSSISNYNQTIRELARRAGIDTPTKVFRAGKSVTAPKWKLLSSHVGRISFVNNMADAGVTINNIAMMSGHRNVNTCFGYIVHHEVALTEAAKKVLGL